MEAPTASSLPSPVAPPLASASATPAPAQQSAVSSQAHVASVVAATHVGAKRRRAGQHVVHPQPAPAAASVVPPATSLAPPASSLAPPKPPATKGRKKKPSLGSKGASGPKVRKTTSRKKPAPAPAPTATSPPVVHEVLDGMPAPPTSFMGLIEDAEVNMGAPPLEPFGFGDDLEEEGDEEEEGQDEEDVTEIEEEAFAAVGKPTVRSTNYSKDEDILLWKLRDQETTSKKSAMLRMDDSDEEERNECKPEGTNKDKLRKKMEGEASSIGRRWNI
ncbi:putative methionyl-tRNA synthetase [Hordeum vulgare]|nr:putative methionyl-tRNA synthetase [Hordeum vulgare]